MKWIYKITDWYFSRNALPYWGVLFVDFCAIIMMGMVSVYLNHGGQYVATYFWEYITLWLFSLPFFMIGMKMFHTYAIVFRYSSFIDLMRVSMALLMGTVLGWGAWALIRHFGVEVPLISIKMVGLMYMLSLLLMWSLRIMIKFVYDLSVINMATDRVLIYGVKEGGLALAKSIKSEHPLRYLVKGFISADPEVRGRYLLGSSVYPPGLSLSEVIESQRIDSVFVSPQSADEFRENDTLVNLLLEKGVKIMMANEAEAWDGKEKLEHQKLHEVDIEDLLPRDKISVDLDTIGALLRDRRILITGAAGSIGSEMVRQVAAFHPASLILIDQAETPMHDIRLYMKRNYPYIPSHTIVGSISNLSQMESIFKEYKPEYVFHAAAYKHVPMMEDNPAMSVQNNIYGTRVMADLSVRYGALKFVMISTDKAVNPTNVMGCSKRICEIYCQSLNNALIEFREHPDQHHPLAKYLTREDGQPGVTQFITTRFGNVLGSSGSVIPIFKEQIQKGGPVTVTHPDIIRYFMLIPEACQLVLEAGTMGNGGEIFIFDMGKPVKIADLARKMIDLSGAKGVEIKYTGVRHGEKLYEEILNDAETTIPTHHSKIKVAKVREYPFAEALRNEEELLLLSFSYNDMEIVRKMKEIVPEYKSSHSKYEELDT